MAKKYYGVKKGKNIGVYDNWAETQLNISGYSNAQYKGFSSREDAEAFVYGNSDITKKEEEINKEVPINSKDLVYIFVDGSYINEKVGYGLVAVKDDKDLLRDSGRFIGKAVSTRNVAGEIYATIRAIQLSKANEFKNVCICYDYKGIENWITGDWKAKNDLTKRYVEYFKEHTVDMNVTFEKVQAHSGNKWNELADKLAKLGTTL